MRSSLAAERFEISENNPNILNLYWSSAAQNYGLSARRRLSQSDVPVARKCRPIQHTLLPEEEDKPKHELDDVFLGDASIICWVISKRIIPAIAEVVRVNPSKVDTFVRLFRFTMMGKRLVNTQRYLTYWNTVIEVKTQIDDPIFLF